MLRCSIFYLSAVCPFQTAQQSTQTQPTHSQTNLCIYVCVFVAKSYARLRAMRIFSISSSARILPFMRYYYSNADALAEIACCFCLTLPSLQGILHTLLSVCMCFCCWCCSLVYMQLQPTYEHTHTHTTQLSHCQSSPTALQGIVGLVIKSHRCRLKSTHR